MSDINLWGTFKPNPTQKEAFDSDARYKCYAGKVGPGKTTWLCAEMFYLNIMVPNNLTVMGRWVKKDLWTSTCANWLELFPPADCPYLTYSSNLDELEWVKFPNGSVMHFVPLADRDKWPGSQLGAFAIDQLEQCQRETLTDLMRRLRRPKTPPHLLRGLATANYEKNWPVFREIFKYKRGIDPNVMLADGRSVADLFQLFTPEEGENEDNLRAGYYEEQRATLQPFERARLIEGKDLENVGMVFPEWSEEIHTAEFEIEDLEKEGPCRYVVSYDYGMKHPSAFHFGVVSQGGRRWYLGEHGGSMMRVATHQAALVALAEKLRFPLERAMYWAGWDIFNTKHEEGIDSEWSAPFKWAMANRSKSFRREKMKEFLAPMPDGKPGMIVHKRCENLIHQMPRLFFDDDAARTGEEKYARGTPDDFYDSASYLLVGSLTPEAPKPVKNSYLTGSNWKKAMKRGYSVPEVIRPAWLSRPHNLPS